MFYSFTGTAPQEFAAAIRLRKAATPTGPNTSPVQETKPILHCFDTCKFPFMETSKSNNLEFKMYIIPATNGRKIK